MSKPAFLEGDASAKWDEVVGQLGEVDPRDEGMIIALCIAWETMVRAVAELKGEPLIQEGAQGNTVTNPLIGIRDRSMAKVIAISIQLGLSPKSRGGGGKKKAVRTVEDLLK